MNKITIAIVIPVFNVEKYVKQTLDSVKNQLSNPDEVIVINDGSTDKSSQIINPYSDLDGWKIIHKNNEGLGITRNYGRSIAKSEYIYFLDSDDIIKNNLINLKFTLQGKYYRDDKLITKLFNKNEILPQASRYITKIKLWSKNNLSYPKGIAEDEAVFFPLLALSEKTIITKETLYMVQDGRTL